MTHIQKGYAKATVCWLLAFFMSATSLAAQSVGISIAPKSPKLVVVVVVDQFRYDYLQKFRTDYTGGIAKLLSEGAVYENAHYLHATTVTAVGHSTITSGAPPSVSGIIANEWYDRTAKRLVTSVSDPATRMVGGVPGAMGSSPWRLTVSTVGDELKMRYPDSRVIGISIKDRSAILPAGHMADGAYWYDNDSNHWVTSTFYLPELPGWVKEVNAARWHDRTLGASWFPLVEMAVGKSDHGKLKPFCTMVSGEAATPFCEGIESTPWGNEMIEEFAEAGIRGENLGHHLSPDLLTVSFSANDYVGHKYGPDDPTVRDISIRTDRLLEKLFSFIDGNVGMENTLIVLTADHGVAPVPEVNAERRMPGGRIPATVVTKAINATLDRKFGSAEGRWLVVGASPTQPYLNHELIQARGLDLNEVQRIAAKAIAAIPHIARVYTEHDIQIGRVQGDEIGKAVSLSFYGGRSSDLYVIPEPYFLIGQDTGTTHGTPYDYDSHVPLIFMGQGIRAGSRTARVAMNDVAPTLSFILGISPPSGSIGKILP